MKPPAKPNLPPIHRQPAPLAYMNEVDGAAACAIALLRLMAIARTQPAELFSREESEGVELLVDKTSHDLAASLEKAFEARRMNQNPSSKSAA